MLKRKQAAELDNIDDFRGLWLDMDFNYGTKRKTILTTNSGWFRITDTNKNKTHKKD